MTAPSLAWLAELLRNHDARLPTLYPDQTTLDDYYRSSAVWRQQCRVARADVADRQAGLGVACACGCGGLVTAWGASPDFADAACQQRWHERRARIAAAAKSSTGEEHQ